MRLRKIYPFIVLIILMFTMGCETAKGFKQDMQNIWSKLGMGEKIEEADKWVKENLW